MKKRLLIILAIILVGFTANAQNYDFTAVSDGQTFYFKITSATAPYTVEVASQNVDYPYNPIHSAGSRIIPATVEYNTNTYAVTAIGDNAFSGYSNVDSFVIPNSITSIGKDAFSGCTSLASITIPNSVTSIGINAFAGCSSLTSITLPNSVTTIGEWAFAGCSGLTSITLPNAITSIDKATFASCSSLSSIIIPSSVTTIGERTFEFCTNLTSVIFPNAVTSVGLECFRACSSLTSVTLPNSITTIEDNTFIDCTSLDSIILPNTVTSIGHAAFGNCSGLTQITSNAIIPPTAQWNSFFSIPSAIPVYVPCESIDAYQAAANWSAFTNYQCFVGLNDILSAETQTKLYPNPTTGSAILEVEGLTKSAEVFVYDITGRKVKTYNLQPNQTHLSIDLTSFAKGIYQVKVLNQTKKLIIN